MSIIMQRRNLAALRHVIDSLEPRSWSEAITERGFRLTSDLESGVLSISASSSVPGPAAPAATCRYPRAQRLQRVNNHLLCLRGDLLGLGLDFADSFSDALHKILNGDPVAIVEYDPTRHDML